MSYLGGLGAGKGWLKFSFLLNHKELQHVLTLTNARLVIENSRVAADYEGTSIEEFVEAYRTYAEKIFDGSRFEQKKDWRFTEGMYMGLFRNSDILRWHIIEKAPNFKLLELSRPIPIISPEMISFTGKTISLARHNDQGYFGLCLSYPKCYSTSQDCFEQIRSTEHEPESGVYQRLISALREFTKTRRFSTGNRQIRPKIHISDGAMVWVNKHYYLKVNGIEVLR